MTEPLLSTMWAQTKFAHLLEFFAAAQEMGFRRYELNHQVTEEMLEGIPPGRYQIPSVHAPCPQTMDLSTQTKNDLLLSSLDEGKRREAVAMAKRSIYLARWLGAQAVVVHLGRVDVEWGMEADLREAFRQGRPLQPIRERLKEARVAKRDANLEAVSRSLLEVAQYARSQAIHIGLENRYYYLEIPSHGEMGELLKLDPEVFHYWHDTGHAQALENLGFTPHEEWLRSYGERMLGVHLHDIVGVRDHGIPGRGEIDFRALASYLPPQVIRVCEFDYIYPPEEVVAGRKHLERMGCL